MGGDVAAGKAAGPVAGRAAPQPSVRAHNWRLVQIDSVFMGVVTASGPFLPVFLLRLGASGSAIGLLTALPALTAVVFAIPFGRWLQGRRNILPWYSRLRLVAWMSYVVMAVAAAVLPREQAVPTMLAIWALAALPSAASLVAFPIVMDGAAGRDGRFDLLGRRWAIAGLSTAVAVVIGGQFLSAVPFPSNFELLLVFMSLAGLGSYLQSSRLIIPDQVRVPRAGEAVPLATRIRALASLVFANRSFTRYELRAVVYTASLGLALPILPLFYVHEVSAPDAWIGVIGAAQSAGGVLGFVVVRQLARRRSGTMALLPSLLAMAMAPAILSVVGWLPAVAAIAFVIGTASAGAQLAMFDALMRRIPIEHGVTFSSVDQTLQNLALVVAPNVGGLIAVALGTRTALVVVAAVGLAAFVLFALDARAARATRRVTATTLAHAAPAMPLEEPTPAD